MIEIKNRWSGKVIKALDVANLSGADLSGAYLSSADLSSANLSGADLHVANLRDADLSSAENAALHIARTVICPEGAFIGWKKWR